LCREPAKALIHDVPNLVSKFERQTRLSVSRGKGLGRGGAKRIRKVCTQAPYAGVDTNIRSITKPFIRRLARRGGVQRISGISSLIYEEA